MWNVIYRSGGTEEQPHQSIEVKSSDRVELCSVTVTNHGRGTSISLDYGELNEYIDSLLKVQRLMKSQRRAKRNASHNGTEPAVRVD